jgi:hypothetical protein
MNLDRQLGRDRNLNLDKNPKNSIEKYKLSTDQGEFLITAVGEVIDRVVNRVYCCWNSGGEEWWVGLHRSRQRD